MFLNFMRKTQDLCFKDEYEIITSGYMSSTCPVLLIVKSDMSNKNVYDT